MNSFTYRVVAAEREGNVRHAAGNQRVRQLAFDVLTGADKVLRVVVVLFNTGGDGKDIRVEDDVFRREAHLFSQNLVGATANLNFAFTGVGLAHFVKSHHHHGCAVAADFFRMLNKRLYALFH